jgi:hypothetical protein
MNVGEAFTVLLGRIEPRDSELESIENKMSALNRRLMDSFGIKKIFLAGSHKRKTAIRNHSDVDFFVLFPVTEAHWGGTRISSSTFIEKVRKDLAGRYPNTQVSKDEQAVVVKFGGGSNSIDVVPAIFHGFSAHKRPVYLIPRGDGDWMLASPDSHDTYINAANDASGGMLRYVARLLKYWRHCRENDVRLSSFHIELYLAQSGLCNGAVPYSYCVAKALWDIKTRQCRALQDPLHISGYIPAAKTAAYQQKVYRSIAASADHAASAWKAENDGNIPEARRQWDIVFNGCFPKHRA